MTTFAKTAFSAKNYAAFRPSYPASLYNTVLGYHKAGPAPRWNKMLDLGCGHGLISRAMSAHFAAVLATDPSAGMVKQAQSTTAQENSNITFAQGSAEDLSLVGEDGSVDMAVAGQAAHWFDYARVWPNLARVVGRGGTVALWGYKDNVLVGKEQATRIMERYIYDFGEVANVQGGWSVEGMGRFWEQPGRNILRDLLRSVKPPPEDWEAVTRLEHEPGAEGDPDEAAWQRKTMKLGEVEGYTRTFSCFTGWAEAYADRKARKDGGEGDIIDVMWDEMVASVPEWKAMGDRWREAEVESDWGTYIIMARRR
ncbi:methyltransferase-like protein [Microdochium trichocladiopsis]|uniref:Methyltransferase-like protein n=1 Tax=Microdochium trichocladiopsis TaxID=1682393 RepID=A0A9P9BR68_9PEZI|nr:methyltransferase-like protein [Microdochium trichocladiopsis]KAH7031550.1 methyltransferase-like protein [Microdochium trichocladiopsis]